VKALKCVSRSLVGNIEFALMKEGAPKSITVAADQKVVGRAGYRPSVEGTYLPIEPGYVPSL
jgi:hypothetical protein